MSEQGIDENTRITVMVNLPIQYSDKPLTPFGGMALMNRFIDQTIIREHLATLDLPQGGSNRAYDPGADHRKLLAWDMDRGQPLHSLRLAAAGSNARRYLRLR